MYCFDFPSMNCPIGCDCQSQIIVNCFDFVEPVQNLHFNFPFKILSIKNDRDLQTLSLLFETQIVYLRIEFCPMKKIVKLNTPNIVILILRYNKIERVDSSDINHLKKLQYLDLTGNKISILPNNFFSKDELRFIDLSENHIKYIDNQIFSSLYKLITLSLRKMEIHTLHKDSFDNLKGLRNFYLNQTKLPPHINKHLLRNLMSLKRLYSESFFLCCLSKKNDLNLDECKPNSSIIKSCSQMIKNKYIIIWMWIIFISGLICNLTALSLQYRGFSPKKTLPIGLLLSDMVVCVFLAIFLGLTKYYANVYIENDEIWRLSATCSILGFIIQSSLLSYNLCLISIVLHKFFVKFYPDLLTKKMKTTKDYSILLISIFSISLILTVIYFVFEVCFKNNFMFFFSLIFF